MRIAVAWNGPGDRVVHEQGMPNREVLPEATIKRVVQGLEQGGHEVRPFAGDMDLAARLEGWLGPQDIVFNLSYGVQGGFRYAHVPSLLEMAGFRYTGADPLAHALCLEKPLAKTVLEANGLPTPDGIVVQPGIDPSAHLPFGYPVVVKPCREAASLGLRLAHDASELRSAVDAVHTQFHQPALVERYAEGTDLMVPILGNRNPDVLPLLESRITARGPQLLTEADKQGRGRRVQVRCPAPLSAATRRRARALALAAYRALGCRDWARIDMRLSSDGDIRILEVNSLPGLDAHSSFTTSAAAAGMEFAELVQRILNVAVRRYARGAAHILDVEVPT